MIDSAFHFKFLFIALFLIAHSLSQNMIFKFLHSALKFSSKVALKSDSSSIHIKNTTQL